ncbi:MAG: sensor histidine kinase [Hyphomicrobium sp.]
MSWHLAALALAAFGPVMALSGWLLSRHIAEAQRLIEREAIAQAEMQAQSTNQAMSGAIGTLRALAASAALKTRDYESFAEQASASFAGAGVTIKIRDRKMALLGPSASSNPEELLSPEQARKALASAEPFVTGFRAASAAAPAGVEVWIRGGPFRGEPLLLQARIPSDYLSRSLASSSVQSPWNVALTDPQQRIIARSSGVKADLGAVLALPAPVAATTASSAMIERGTNVDGTPEIRAIAPTSVAGWRIVTNAPRATIEQRLDDYWRGFLTIAALLGCLMAGGAGFVAASISRSISTLSANARTLTSGAPLTPLKTSIREVGELMAAITQTRDELGRRQAALRDSDHRLRMALDAGGMGVWEWDHASDEMTWDPVQFDLTGLPRGERPPSGKAYVARIAEDDRATFSAAMASLTPDDPAFAVEFRFRRFDGETRWLAGRGLLLVDDGGAPRGMVGVNYDITEQRSNADRTASLLREVSHRSKNMLALILAMARLTARDASDVQSHLKEFSARVSGLAASQDLIVAADWQNVDVEALAAAQAKAIAHDSANRIAISGPPVAVTPEAAQTLGMVFAELTLNAIEHGALSTSRGRVDLWWDVDGDALRMTWRETDGPPVSPCERRGYGMSVVERFAEQGLQAKARIDAKPEGLEWSLSAPLTSLGAANRSEN